MARHENSPGIPLPRGWPRRVKSAMLNVIALAQYAAAYRPSALIAGQLGDRVEIEVGFHDGRRHPPIVSLRRAA